MIKQTLAILLASTTIATASPKETIGAAGAAVGTGGAAVVAKASGLALTGKLGLVAGPVFSASIPVLLPVLAVGALAGGIAYIATDVLDDE